MAITRNHDWTTPAVNPRGRCLGVLYLLRGDFDDGANSVATHG